jgi:hypothetical protein
MEIETAHQGAINVQKRKLNAHKSLGKGGSIIAIDALAKIKEKRCKEADKTLQKAQRLLRITTNKAQKEFKD